MSGTRLRTEANREVREEILRLHLEGTSVREIARQVGRDKNTVTAYLASVAPSVEEAKVILGHAAAGVATAFVEHAKNEPHVALEYFDRKKILPKVRDAPQVGMHLQVLIGGATSGPGNIVPTQAQIVAIQAEQKALEEGEPDG